MSVDSDIKAYSFHNFIFPFSWQSNADVNFTDINFLKGSKEWKNLPFEIKTEKDHKAELNHIAYNEYVYFHSQIRSSLYQIPEGEDNHLIVRYFEYLIEDGLYYKIKISKQNKDNDERELYLQILDITLHLFNSNIGVLSFNLANTFHDQSSPSTILLINEFGRRLYPQFLGSDGAKNAQKIFLAESISIVKGHQGPIDQYQTANNLCVISTLEEQKYDDSYLKKIIDSYPNLPVPEHINFLFEDTNFTFNKKCDKDQIKLNYLSDDRMFFMCWFGNNEFSTTVSADFTKNDWWYQYINGDAYGKSIANASMQREEMVKATYTRWKEYGTLFGMSNDSFVCLSCDQEYMEQKELPRLDIHMRSIYYQVCLLCLVQKYSILFFSKELFSVPLSENKGNSISKSKELYNIDRLYENVSRVYRNYLNYIHDLFFRARQMSAQIQGIEIYEQFHGLMKIQEDCESLKSELKDMNDYIGMLLQKRQSDKTDELNKAVFYLNRVVLYTTCFAIMISIFGTGFISEDMHLCPCQSNDPYHNLFAAVIISIVVGFVFARIIDKTFLSYIKHK